MLSYYSNIRVQFLGLLVNQLHASIPTKRGQVIKVQHGIKNVDAHSVFYVPPLFMQLYLRPHSIIISYIKGRNTEKDIHASVLW